ncbi:hypothetical protein [Vibrio splendidus]|uniref:hypothetical protein n=1 Tax=Vibrio splendidus TaxID=29497 RepID=UPI00352D5819
MGIIESKDLSFKQFQLIKILPDDSNYEEIMRFCGWSDEDINQEFIFHSEGSPTIIGSEELCDRDGDFVIKWEDGATKIIPANDIMAYIEF